MSISNNIKRFKRYINEDSVHYPYSEWTSSQTVEFNDGETLQEKLDNGSIDSCISTKTFDNSATLKTSEGGILVDEIAISSSANPYTPYWDGQLEQGGITQLGTNTENTDRLRMVGYVEVKKGDVVTPIHSGLQFSWRFYKEDKTFDSSASAWSDSNTSLTASANGYYRYVVRNTSNTDLTPSDASGMQIYVNGKLGTIASEGNWFDNQFLYPYTLDNSGKLSYQESGTYSTNPSIIPCKPNDVVGIYYDGNVRTSSWGIRITWYKNDGTFEKVNGNNGANNVEFTAPSNTYGFRITIYSSVESDAKTMAKLTTVTINDKLATVVDTYKTVWDEQLTRGLGLNANGTVSASSLGAKVSASDYQECNGNDEVVIISKGALRTTAGTIYVGFYDENKAFIEPRVNATKGVCYFSAIAPSNAKYFIFSLVYENETDVSTMIADTTVYIVNQFNRTYIPHSGLYSFNGKTDSIEVVGDEYKGVHRVGVSIWDGSADESWGSSTYNDITIYKIARPSNIVATSGAICDKFDYKGEGQANITDGGFYLGGSSWGFGCNSIATVDKWREELAKNPMILLYEKSSETTESLEQTPFYMIKAYDDETTLSIPSNTIVEATMDFPTSDAGAKIIKSLIDDITIEKALKLKANSDSPVFSGSISMGRQSGSTVGTNSVALGNNVTASGNYSTALGATTTSLESISASNVSLSTYSSYTSITFVSNTTMSLKTGDTVYIRSVNGTSTTVKLTSDVNLVSNQSATINFTPNYATMGATTATVNIYIDKPYQTVASGNYSFATGCGAKATGSCASAEGYGVSASGSYSHAEGYFTNASSQSSHAEGYKADASGYYAHAEGYNTIASNSSAHAEGGNTTAKGNYAHAEGYYSVASGNYSHVEGYNTRTEGSFSHASGSYSTAYGDSSFAHGDYVSAQAYGTTIGHYNATIQTGASTSSTNGTAFVIGNGTDNSALSNAFSVMYNGVVKAKSTITGSTTADYAELFEWKDENPNAEDRVGLFVTIDGDKISVANEDDYILGIVSGQPFVLGNGDCDTWNHMYLHDEFNRVIYENAPLMVEVMKEVEVERVNPETGEIETVKELVPTGEYEQTKDEKGELIFEGTRPVLNPDYDPTRPYISRMDRPEWSPIALCGIVSVYDDGTCEVNKFCKCGENGIGTASTDKYDYRVLERISENIVKVLVR